MKRRVDLVLPIHGVNIPGEWMMDDEADSINHLHFNAAVLIRSMPSEKSVCGYM